MFRERIKGAYESLTPSFKRLGEFILNNELDVAFMTATELAEALGVDAATVVRFSQALGYRGYRELSHEVQQLVKADLTAKYAHFDEASTSVEQLRALLENERHNLEIAISQVTEQGTRIVDLLADAEHVWVMGEGGAHYLAEFFADHLRMAGVKAYGLSADPAEAARVLWNLGKRDLVIGLGMPGTGLGTAAVLRFARERGAGTAAVSVSAVSPAAQAAEHVLLCAANSPIGLPSAASLVTVLMVVWQALLARKGEQLTEHVATLHNTYKTLLATQAEQSQALEPQQLWRDF